MSAFGTKRTSGGTQSMSALGVKRTSSQLTSMSVIDPKRRCSAQDYCGATSRLEPRRRSKNPWRLTIVTTTRLCGAQIDVLNRDCADTFAGCGKDGIEDCGCGHRNCRLANSAPEFVVRHDHRLDLRHRVETHHLPGIEISLLDATVAHRAFAVQ